MHALISAIFPYQLRRTITAATLRASLLTLTLVITSCATPIPDGPVTTPTPNASPIDQITIDKNGCGPTALLNAYHFASPAWQTGYYKLGKKPDTTPKQKFKDLTDNFGLHISPYNGMLRWDKRIGISAQDLTDMANDYQRARRTNLPPLKFQTHFNPIGEANNLLLQDVHKKLRTSLLNGFPPILTIKRFTNRTLGDFKIWKQIHGHFVILYQIPGKIDPLATSFQIKYIDPWGGRILTGTVKIPDQSFYAIDGSNRKNLKFRKSPTLIVDFPHSKLGKHLVRKGERNVTILASSIAP